MTTFFSRTAVSHRLIASAFALAGAAVTTPAAALECTLDFPTLELCGPQDGSGSSSAAVSHSLEFDATGFHFHLSINMLGGTSVAVAYGIDENGNHLNRSDQTAVADQDETQNGFEGVDAEDIFGFPGFLDTVTDYQHPVDIVQTFVVVI